MGEKIIRILLIIIVAFSFSMWHKTPVMSAEAAAPDRDSMGEEKEEKEEDIFELVSSQSIEYSSGRKSYTLKIRLLTEERPAGKLVLSEDGAELAEQEITGKSSRLISFVISKERWGAGTYVFHVSLDAGEEKFGQDFKVEVTKKNTNVIIEVDDKEYDGTDEFYIRYLYCGGEIEKKKNTAGFGVRDAGVYYLTRDQVREILTADGVIEEDPNISLSYPELTLTVKKRKITVIPEKMTVLTDFDEIPAPSVDKGASRLDFVGEDSMESLGLYLVSEADPETAGSYNIIIKGSEPLNYDVVCYGTGKIEILRISGIGISSLPEKTVYEAGQELDLSGLSVKYFISDGTSVLLDEKDYVVSGFDSSSGGICTVSILWGHFQCMFRVTVHEMECVHNYVLKKTIREPDILNTGIYLYECTKCGLQKTTSTDPLTAVSVSTLTVDKIPDQTYTGNLICPVLSVYSGTEKLRENTDYVVSYHHYRSVGQAYILMEGRGIYQGSRMIFFRIIPPKTKVKKIRLKRSGKKYRYTFTLKKIKNVNVYECRVGQKTYRSISNVFTVKVKKKWKKKAIKKIKARVYKICDGKKYYSVWN